jgi:hypothetical protein
VSESYEGRQFVGMDLRRRSVLVRMTESGEHLETVRILNDRDRLAEALSRAGESPGVWRAESSNLFVRPFLVGDVATMSVTLMTKSLEYVDAVSRLILCNKPHAASQAHPLLGLTPEDPGWNVPEPHHEEAFHRAMFGWHQRR